jgi:exopolysaccharide biosynthesis protein
MRRIYRITCLVILAILCSITIAYADSSYSNENINGIKINYITINMDNQNIKPVILNANNQMNSSESLEVMAKNEGAFAAVNGTYFEAYGGTPVSWGSIIKDGKILHISNGGSVFGITDDGKFLVDRLSFDFEGYVNGVYRAIPWRINHPSIEEDAITIFTPEYGVPVGVSMGAKAVVVSNGRVDNISTSDFNVPADGFAIVYNSSAAYLVDERYKVGDEVYYKVNIRTTFTNPSDWENVVCGLGAGPSLIINGTVTADGYAEGFTEAKINTNSAGRSFIGAKEDGSIVFGNLDSATVADAAEACKQMGLINAMCLDGGGSVALYYPSSNISMCGRKINNGLAFIEEKTIEKTAKPEILSMLVNGNKIELNAYKIENSNYFNIRDLARVLNNSSKEFDIVWDNERNAINIVTEREYSSLEEDETLSKGENTKSAYLSKSAIYLDGNKIEITAYNIDNNNYFKLRDIAEQMNFNVLLDSTNGSIIIETN